MSLATVKTPFSEIFKRSCQVSMSLGLQRSIQAVMNFVGMLMVARLGHLALAASALIFMVQMLVGLFGGSFFSCVGIKTAQAFGAKQYAEIGKAVRNGIVLALVLGLILDLIVWSVSPLLLLLHQPVSTVLLARKFFDVYMIIVPIAMLSMVLTNVVISIDKKKIFLGVFAVTSVIWILLAYAFIFGRWGFPGFGIVGYAYAMLVSTLISVLIYAVYFLRSTYFKQFALKATGRFAEFTVIKELTKIGFPIGTHMLSIALFGIVTTVMVGWLGSSALAIQQIVGQYFLLLAMPVLAIAQASTVLVAQSYGAKNPVDAKRYANATLLISLAFTVVIMLVMLLAPHFLIHLYVGQSIAHFSDEMMSLAVTVLMITGSRLVFDSILENNTASLRGIADVKFPAVLNIIMSWPILLPLSYVAMFVLGWGLVGLNVCIVASYLVQALILWGRWKSKSRGLIAEVN